jgi:hypothetical protein
MSSVRFRVVRATALAAVAGVMTALATSATPAAPVKQIFEKYKLIGTFSYDCSKPADKKNNYFVSRLIDADHVRRDLMSGPTTRDWTSVIDKAEEVNAYEVKVHSTRNGESVESVWLIEPGRMLQWQAATNGKATIQNGEFLSTRYRMPWLNRCGD